MYLNTPGAKEHQGYDNAQNLAASANKELGRRRDFAAKLKDADRFMTEKRFAEARDAYVAARNLWPLSPERPRISKGIDDAEAALKDKAFNDLLAEGFAKIKAGDPDAALEIFKRAKLQRPESKDATEAIAGCAIAFYHKGFRYSRGTGVVKNDVEAVRLLHISAELGAPEGMLALGHHLESGFGCNKNEAEAMSWFRKAAQKGFEPAQQLLKKRGLK